MAEMEVNNMMNENIYNVIGLDDLEGMIFARCTTFEKAQRAKEITEANGFEGMIDIVQDETPVDVVEINGKVIEL